jgi:tagaturonate reductase
VCKTAEQWKLGGAFADWVRTGNVFTNTLVDRITTGYPKEDAAALQAALGYEDALLNTAEPFGLWVVQGPAGVAAEFPLDKAGQPLLFTDNAAPYKLRKVRMLNGAHTCTVLGAYLAGLNTVGECMADADIRAYLERALHQEIMPVLSLPQQELQVFADAVIERFENPFNRHYLLNIALNSVSKFRARVLPTLQDYRRKKGTLPPVLTFSLAALLAFYRGKPTPDGFCGQRGGDAYAIVDDQPVLDFFAAHGEDALDTLADAALARVDFWGEDLRGVPGLAQAVTEGLRQIEEKGAKAAMTAVSRSQPA